MNTSEWLKDLGDATEELGYGIISIKPGEIRLLSKQGGIDIKIRSYHMSGDHLRGLLLKREHQSASPSRWEPTVDRPSTRQG